MNLKPSSYKAKRYKPPKRRMRPKPKASKPGTIRSSPQPSLLGALISTLIARNNPNPASAPKAPVSAWQIFVDGVPRWGRYKDYIEFREVLEQMVWEGSIPQGANISVRRTPPPQGFAALLLHHLGR